MACVGATPYGRYRVRYATDSVESAIAEQTAWLRPAPGLLERMSQYFRIRFQTTGGANASNRGESHDHARSKQWAALRRAEAALSQPRTGSRSVRVNRTAQRAQERDRTRVGASGLS
jgi:hypothetical protein